MTKGSLISAQAFAMVPNRAVLDHDLPLPALRFLCVIALGRDSVSGWTRMSSGLAIHRMGYKTRDHNVIGRLSKILLDRGYIDYVPGNGHGMSRYRVVYDQARPSEEQMRLEDEAEYDQQINDETDEQPDLGGDLSGRPRVAPASRPRGDATSRGATQQVAPDATQQVETYSRLSLQDKDSKNPKISESDTLRSTPPTAPQPVLPLPPSDLPPSPETNQAKPKRQEKPTPDTAALALEFAAFYRAYPRKVARMAAEKAYAKARNSATAENILAGLARFEFPADPKYTPHPASWLNGRRWEDEPAPSLADDPWGLNAWLEGPKAPQMKPDEEAHRWVYAEYVEVMEHIGLPETWRGDLSILGRWSRERFVPDSVCFVLRQRGQIATTSIAQIAGPVDQWAKRYSEERGTHRIPDPTGRGFNEGEHLPQWLERRQAA